MTVVGSSVAGLYAAGLLARGGASVEVLERDERLDPVARTLIVTSHMRDLLGAAGEPSRSEVDALTIEPLAIEPLAILNIWQSRH